MSLVFVSDLCFVVQSSSKGSKGGMKIGGMISE